MIDAAVYVFAVAIAATIGYFLPAKYNIEKYLGRVVEILLFALMMTMGINIGFDPNIYHVIGWVGLKALGIAVFSVAGSVLVLYLFQKYYYQDSNRRLDIYQDDTEKTENTNSLGATVAIIIFLVAGFLIARNFADNNLMIWIEKNIDTLIKILLIVMVSSAGIALGRNSGFLHEFKRNWFLFICVPLGIIIGSVVGGALIAFLSSQSIIEFSAVSAGCTWYSAAGAMLSEHSPELGLLALLANMIREVIALIITPYVAKKLGPLPSIAPSGAASMDVLHSLIVKSNGKGLSIIAFANGLMLTMLVPLVLNVFLFVLG